MCGADLSDMDWGEPKDRDGNADKKTWGRDKGKDKPIA